MNKKVNFILKIILICWGVIAIYLIMSEFNFNQMKINGNVYIMSSVEEIVYKVIFCLIFLLASFISPPFNIIIIYLIYQKNIKDKIRINSKFDKQNLGYCREHLNQLSPGIVSYLKNFNIEFEKDISAHILKLLYEGYLEEKDGLIRASAKSNISLNKTDLFVLCLVEKGEYNKGDIVQYEKLVEDEATNEGLITYKKKEWKKVIIKFIVFFLFSVAIFNIFIVSNSLSANFNEKTATIILLALVIGILFISIYPIIIIINIFSLLKGKTSIIRTTKGNKITKNIFSLEKFLNEFGALDKCYYKEVYTREYFLIYAVVFGINKNVSKEILKKCHLLN